MILKSEEVVGGSIKELHWWTRNIRNDTAHLYLEYFSLATDFIRLHPNTLALDGSQSTIWETGYTQNLCDIPRLMSIFLPDAKYILIMREPVSRLYSDFLYFCQNRGNFSSAKHDFHLYTLAEIARFNDCISHHPLSICVRNSTHDFVIKETCRGVRLGIGIYYDHISRWLKYVPRQQFLFLRTEDMARDPYSTVQQVWRFLSVKQKPKEDLTSLLYSQRNKNPHDDMLPETKQILTSFYEVYNQMLTDYLNDTRYRWRDNWFLELPYYLIQKDPNSPLPHLGSSNSSPALCTVLRYVLCRHKASCYQCFINYKVIYRFIGHLPEWWSNIPGARKLRQRFQINETLNWIKH